MGTRSFLGSGRPRAAFALAFTLAFLAVAAGCRWRGGFLELSTEQKVASAQADLAEGKWSRAAEKFRILAGVYRGTPQFAEVQYGLGKAYAGLEDIPAAERELNVVVQDFPGSEWADDALFTIAESYANQIRPAQLDQSGTYQAIEKLRDFLRRYPESNRASEAQALLLKARGQLAKKEIDNGDLYLRLGDGPAARVHFEIVLTDFQDTPWKCRALFGVGESYTKEDRWGEAVAVLQKVVQECPNDEHAPKSLERIQEIESQQKTLEARGGGS